MSLRRKLDNVLLPVIETTATSYRRWRRMSHILIAPSQTSALVIVKCVCVLNLTFGLHHFRGVSVCLYVR